MSMPGMIRPLGADAAGDARHVFVVDGLAQVQAGATIGLRCISRVEPGSVFTTDWSCLDGKHVTILLGAGMTRAFALALGARVRARNPDTTVQVMPSLPDVEGGADLRRFLDLRRGQGRTDSEITAEFDRCLGERVHSIEEFQEFFGPAASNGTTPPPPPPAQPNPTTEQFLTALFDGLEGVIEIRRFSDDKKEQGLLGRGWFGSSAECVAALEEMLALSAKDNSGIFFGVLPRRAKGGGTAEDVLPGRVVWADLDTKDYAGGIDELRKRVEQFPIKPSIVVWSGHGVHLYWLLREPAEPAKIASINERIARVLGGDHAWDRARVLRLPGSFNRKDPTKPIAVEIRQFEPDRRYNESEIADALDLLPVQPKVAPAKAGVATSDTPKIALPADVLTRGISPDITALIRSDKKFGAAFLGVGKPETGKNGQKLDHTGSGLDFSCALALVGRGIVDPVEIAVTLVNRPDGHARGKGREYLERTVAKVLATLAGEKEPKTEIDFEVAAVRIYRSDPPTYVLTINKRELRLEIGELTSKSKFSQRFLATFERIPSLPRKSQEWTELVNGWLANAEKVDQPPEATRHGALQDAVLTVIENMAVGDEASDLDASKAVLIDGSRKAFKVAGLIKLVAEELPDVKRNAVCSLLTDLKFENMTHWIGAKSVRVWVAPKEGPGAN